MAYLNNYFHQKWIKIQSKKTFTLISLPLALLSFLYVIVVRIRLIWCNKKRGKSLKGFVVSIGNLTTGGTGKTPATHMLAEWAFDKGFRTAILSRGFRGRYRTRVFEVSDEHGLKAGPVEAGDEPYLLARKLPGVPVVLSKKRYLAGLIAEKKYASNFFILDDGFQHIQLKRDLNLVLMDSVNPFSNGHLLPWGTLREPVDQLKRADVFIITRSGRKEADHNLVGLLKKKFPGKPLFLSDHIPDQVVFPFINETRDPSFLYKKRILAFAGIAQPEVLRESLLKLGTELVFFKGFSDHHPFTYNEIQFLLAHKESLKADYIIITEKDWVRVKNILPEYADMAYLSIKFSLLGETGAFFEMIKEKYDKSIKMQGL